jgi:glycosyltransferase involved in cell wall biosynthesis
LHVLIDLTQVPSGRMGIGSYAENLLSELRSVAPDIELTVVLQSDDAALQAVIPPRARAIRVPSRLFRRLPFRFALEQLYLPWLAWRRGAGVIHSLHYSLPEISGGARRVVTMHDMTAFALPHMHPPVKGAYMRFFIRRAVRRADRLIFVSASALEECRRWFGLPLANAAVVHHGKGEAFAPGERPERRAALQARYGLPERYILYLGTLEPRKNVPLLLRAFAGLAADHPEARLVLAGKKGWYFDEIFRTVERLNLAGQVLFTGYVEEEDKADLMRGALLFVYPSVYEGFGIPVLEAMAAGVATVAGNRTSIPEIAGDGARLVDPESLPELAGALRELYEDERARAELAARGLAQAARFSWRSTAEQTAAIYREAGAARHRAARD